MKITDKERFVVFAAMQGAWQGTEAQLLRRLEAYEQLELAEFESYVRQSERGPIIQDLEKRKISETLRERTALPQEVAEFLLDFLPQHATPAALGPSKVHLLRRLRELAPVNEDDQVEDKK